MSVPAATTMKVTTVLINMDDNFKIISINAAGNALENFAASDTAGDADGDGYFTIKDSVLVAQYLAGYDVSANVVGFDYNQDGLVNLKDSYLMFKTCLN